MSGMNRLRIQVTVSRLQLSVIMHLVLASPLDGVNTMLQHAQRLAGAFLSSRYWAISDLRRLLPVLSLELLVFVLTPFFAGA